ncbi:MAG: methylated-DNA--[protein]-cysteine S-methyltransferase [Prevotellaceae bacterium]|nr:methylated-DNA--[protein]-cysteine S-methyltransferase [Prevotellaceae bacterium]
MIEIERINEKELKNLAINYSFAETIFGQTLTAATEKGVCLLIFENDKKAALADMEKRFPKAAFTEKIDDFQQNALKIFAGAGLQPVPSKNIKLHLKGTDFQFKVWQSLLEIPFGKTSTYGKIAEAIGQKTAHRAVGNAVGQNPVSMIIPCHRVLQSSGKLGGYRWGVERKKQILEWEKIVVNG